VQDIKESIQSVAYSFRKDRIAEINPKMSVSDLKNFTIPSSVTAEIQNKYNDLL
jgi:hypothetical protein